jgi:hypothetical protein
MLLALKLRAFRTTDVADVRLLLDHLDIVDAEDALALHDRFFPDDELGQRQRMMLDDVLARNR